jgi:hypothetical protein
VSECSAQPSRVHGAGRGTAKIRPWQPMSSPAAAPAAGADAPAAAIGGNRLSMDGTHPCSGSPSPGPSRPLRDTPVVSLVGPRQAGKSTLAQTLVPLDRYVILDEATTGGPRPGADGGPCSRREAGWTRTAGGLGHALGARTRTRRPRRDHVSQIGSAPSSPLTLVASPLLHHRPGGHRHAGSRLGRCARGHAPVGADP